MSAGWGAAALLAWCWAPPRARILAVVFLLGAARAAVIGAPTPLDGADDRRLDRVAGTIEGPVLRVPGGQRVVIEANGARVQVTVVGAAQLLPGDRIEVRGRLRTPIGYRVPGADPQQHMIRANIAASMTVPASALRVVAQSERWSLWRTPARVHGHLSRVMEERGGDGDGNGVVRAMVLGDRSGLSPGVVDAFRDAGVSHVLAVSGLHLAVVALLLFTVVRRRWASVPALALRLSPSRAAALTAAPVAVAFTLMTGARVSTLRALAVVLVVLLGVVLERRARLIDALGAAAVIILAADPRALNDPSFQLSFAATAVLALALGARPQRGVLGGLVRASWWAFWATAPFTALWFGTIAPGGLVANLVVVPVVELIVLPVGLAGAVIVELWPGLGGALIDGAVIAAAHLVDAVAWFASWVPVVHVAPPTALHLVGFGVALAGALFVVRGGGRRRLALAMVGAGALAVAVAVVLFDRAEPERRDQLRIAFLDVGQGDAAVVETPEGETWLIDAGGLPFVASRGASDQAQARKAESPGELSVARYLWSRRARRIDRVVISHPHPDHYLGLRALARRFEIGELWIAMPHPEALPAVDFVAIVVQLRFAGTRVVHPPMGRTIAGRGVRTTVLHPQHHHRVAATDPSLGVNDNSLTLLLEWAGRRVLFAGDLEAEGEEVLVERHGATLAADVVKVGHHGSKTSSTSPFVAATRPSLAVISCGRANRFGFPDPGVVSRWRRGGARVLRIDELGTVVVAIDRAGVIRVTPNGKSAQ